MIASMFCTAARRAVVAGPSRVARARVPSLARTFASSGDSSALVLGGSGSLGRSLVSQYAENGWNTVSIDITCVAAPHACRECACVRGGCGGYGSRTGRVRHSRHMSRLAERTLTLQATSSLTRLYVCGCVLPRCTTAVWLRAPAVRRQILTSARHWLTRVTRAASLEGARASHGAGAWRARVRRGAMLGP